MSKARTFADAIGRKKIAEALGVGLTAVSNHVVRGSFPASWFRACQDLALASGCEFDPALFGMRANQSGASQYRLAELPESGGVQ